MSSSPAAPSSASITAWVATSASECPSRPRSVSSSSTPARISGLSATSRWESYPMPLRALIVRAALADRLEPTVAAVEDRERACAYAVEQLERVVVAVGEVVRRVRIRRQGDRAAGFEAHLEEGTRRVDLADRLAQPGGRDLDRDVRLRYAVHR